MGTLMVPPFDEQPWPTLGPEIAEFLEDRCVHGPGDLKGRPYRLDDDKRAFLYRMYEVYPRGHPRAGKRRFKRCVLSLRKGTAKTELASAIAFAELHPEGPVRTDGWRMVDGVWQPVGRPVTDPYIPMVAYTEEQTEDLAYAALYMMCELGEDPDLFDIGLDRIIRLNDRGRPDGKAVALASSPDSRDGARTTFQHVDEPHRWTLPRLIEAHETMLQNIPKRPLADPWTLETSTTYTPGEGSVMQASHEDAEQIAAGKVKDTTYFFFHREAEARDGEDLNDPVQLRAAIVEASGPAIAQWPDFDGQVESIAALYHQAVRRGNGAYFERVWLNRRKQSGRQAFDVLRWKSLAWRGRIIRDKEPVAVGLDGSMWRDSTAVVVTDLLGWQHLAGIWEHDGSEDWQVDVDAVDSVIDEIFGRWYVVRMYGDPAQGWDGPLARYAGKYGPKRVLTWYTDSRNDRKHAEAVRSYHSAMRTGEVSHDGDERFERHIGNSRKKYINLRDDEGQPLWVIEKERRDSPLKMDAGVAGVLSWQARRDAIATGLMKPRKPSRMVVMTR